MHAFLLPAALVLLGLLGAGQGAPPSEDFTRLNASVYMLKVVHGDGFTRVDVFFADDLAMKRRLWTVKRENLGLLDACGWTRSLGDEETCGLQLTFQSGAGHSEHTVVAYPRRDGRWSIALEIDDYNRPAFPVEFVDIDGDGVPEAIAFSWWKEKQVGGRWRFDAARSKSQVWRWSAAQGPYLLWRHCPYLDRLRPLLPKKKARW